MTFEEMFNTLIRTYAAFKEVKESRLSTLIFGYAGKIKSAMDRSSFYLRDFQLAVEWFNSNWPEELPWPEEAASLLIDKTRKTERSVQPAPLVADASPAEAPVIDTGIPGIVRAMMSQLPAEGSSKADLTLWLDTFKNVFEYGYRHDLAAPTGTVPVAPADAVR